MSTNFAGLATSTDSHHVSAVLDNPDGTSSICNSAESDTDSITDADDETTTNHVGRMISGALWAIGGSVVTAWSYSAAQDGGMYIVAWGAILFGAIDFFAGLLGCLGEAA